MYSSPVTISPPRAPIEYDDFEPITRISPPRVIEEMRPPIVYRSPEPEAVTLTDLPRDVLIELLINLPPGRLFDLCGTSSALSRLCNDESFLRNLIVRKYGVSINMIPGGTIKEKYAFISQFDPRYFTDPDFVKITANYKRYYGLNYTSRRNPNDALNTIVSILNDAQTADDINVLRRFDTLPLGVGYKRVGSFSPRLVSLLSGAVMTKNQSFAKQIISILMNRITVGDHKAYNVSLRYPFILSVEYGMNEVRQLIKHYHNRDLDRILHRDILNEISELNSIEVLDRFISLLVLDTRLYWNMVHIGNYDLSDYILDKLRNKRDDPYGARSGIINLRVAISKGNINKIRYLMKYVTPKQNEIDLAIRKGFPNIARILQGQDEEEIGEGIEEFEDDMDIIDE